MTDKKKCGATKKFPNIETSKLRIDRVVPKEQHDEIKERVNNLINHLQTQSLKNCADEVLKQQ